MRVLDLVEIDPITDEVVFTPAAPDAQGALPTPTSTRFYRFKKGSIGQDGHMNPVDGVLLSEQQIIMRTESAIVEALLGESDALDQCAMEIQEAAAPGDTFCNTIPRGFACAAIR